MGFLKKLWQRRYQVLVLSEEGGWSRSYWFKLGSVIITLAVIVLLLGGLVVGWWLATPRLRDFTRLLEDRQQLITYRDQVRQVILHASRYGALPSDLLLDLGLAVGIEELGDSSVTQERFGGIRLGERYVNFLENVPTLPPVDGFVTRGPTSPQLDWHGGHEGIDIAAPMGSAILAAASGMVVFSRWTEDLGNLIIISHGDGYFTVYGHNQTNLVATREMVQRGQGIALLGKTGRSQGAHLHFEIWKDGESMNPRDFMELYKRQDVSMIDYGERR